MSRNKQRKTNANPMPPQDKGKKDRRLGRWIVLNTVAGVIGIVVFTLFVNFDSSYHWLWYKYSSTNIKHFKEDIPLNFSERMIRNLGVDYSYLITLRALTPENAIIFYPGREDFLATPPVGEKLPFRGNLVDKLTAVRVLYPRKVVLREELDKSSYANKLTHIAIVNGRNRDMVGYPTDTMSTIDVLPTDARYYVPF